MSVRTCTERTQRAIKMLERPQPPNLFLEIGRKEWKRIDEAQRWIHIHPFECEECKELAGDAWKRAQGFRMWVTYDRSDILRASLSGVTAGMIFGIGLAWLKKRIRGF